MSPEANRLMIDEDEQRKECMALRVSALICSLLLTVGCVSRTHRHHLFILEIQGPAPGDFEGRVETIVTKGSGSDTIVKEFHSSEFTERPIVIGSCGESVRYALANNGAAPVTVAWRVDGKARTEATAVLPETWGNSEYSPGPEGAVKESTCTKRLEAETTRTPARRSASPRPS